MFLVIVIEWSLVRLKLEEFQKRSLTLQASNHQELSWMMSRSLNLSLSSEICYLSVEGVTPYQQLDSSTMTEMSLILEKKGSLGAAYFSLNLYDGPMVLRGQGKVTCGTPNQNDLALLSTLRKLSLVLKGGKVIDPN
jgi:hypothetical protein